MGRSLEGVSETSLVALWARAVEMEQFNPIVKDDKAVEIMGKIDYDFAKLDEEWATQVSVVVRTELLDKATSMFINKNPCAVIVNIGCGLDTRYYRLNNPDIYWYDIDLPEVIDIRRRFFEESDHYFMISKSVFDYSWINLIPKDKPVLIIAEGIFMYFTEDEVKELLNKFVNMFPNAEMLIETIPYSLVAQNKKQDLINEQYQIEAEFGWGIKKG